jgi:serine/threonine protein kinase
VRAAPHACDGPGQGIGFRNDELYIVTEFVGGGTLRALLARSAPSWPRRITMAIEVAKALDHLHSLNIVHRDVKTGAAPSTCPTLTAPCTDVCARRTENVLMTADLVVKLCDFGFAREVAALRDPHQYTYCGAMSVRARFTTATDAVLPWPGSEFFEAPEIMFCMDYDERVDVFSYGAHCWCPTITLTLTLDVPACTGLVLCELLSRVAPSATAFPRVVPGFGISAYVRIHVFRAPMP